MTSRRKFLALLGFGAGAAAATVAIAKQHPKPPPPKYIGSYNGVVVNEVDDLQSDYNKRRSLVLGTQHARLKADTPIACGWRFV